MKSTSTDSRAAEVYRTAAAIILARGYDATSVSDIADALGLTKAGLYHYIKGKTELLYEIMRYGFEELEREVLVPASEIADPEERLRFLIARHAHLVLRGDGAVTILVDETRALTAAQNRAVTRLKRRYIETVRSTLEELRASGMLREVDPTVAAFSIAGSINWLSRWYKPEGKLSAEDVAANIIAMIFHGLSTPAGSAAKRRGPRRAGGAKRRR